MGKGVVTAHDVPGFITNRVGSYAFQAAIAAAHEFGLGFDEIDSITGAAMGRPNSATFRTLDLVGLDIYSEICDNLQTGLRRRYHFQERKVSGRVEEVGAEEPRAHIRRQRLCDVGYANPRRIRA